MQVHDGRHVLEIWVLSLTGVYDGAKLILAIAPTHERLVLGPFICSDENLPSAGLDQTGPCPGCCDDDFDHALVSCIYHV